MSDSLSEDENLTVIAQKKNSSSTNMNNDNNVNAVLSSLSICEPSNNVTTGHHKDHENKYKVSSNDISLSQVDNKTVDKQCNDVAKIPVNVTTNSSETSQENSAKQSSSLTDLEMFIKPATFPDFTQDPLDIEPSGQHSQIPTPEGDFLTSVVSTPCSNSAEDIGEANTPEPSRQHQSETNPLAPNTIMSEECNSNNYVQNVPRPQAKLLKKSVSIISPTKDRVKEKLQKSHNMVSKARRGSFSETTPLLTGCRSYPNVAEDTTSAILDYPGPSTHTRSEIGRDELRKKRRRNRRRRYNTEHSEPQRLMRPFIASPFMPIPTQVSSDVDRRSFIGGISKDANKNVLQYGSTARPAEEGLLRRKSEDESDTEDEASSSSDESEVSIKKPFFFDLSSKEWLTIAMLAIANLSSTVAFSCIAPFYPSEAALKGMTETQTGMVFGVFELTMFLTAPIFGKYMIAIGSKRMFIVGLAITGVTAILFGFLNFIPSGTLFFWTSFIIRIFEAVGDAAFITSSFAICAKCFPGRITVIVGIMETFAGLGYSAGPLIGGFLYEFGGFQVPFLFLGIMLLVIALLSFCLLENQTDQEANDEKGITTMLKIPVIWIMLYAIVACAISLSYLDPTLAGHLLSFELSPTWVGIMFLLCGGVYTIAAPVCGWLIDQCRCTIQLMLLGSLLNIFGMLLIGPSPILPLEKNIYLIGFSLSVLGVAAGAQYIPTFQACLDAAKDNGYEDNFHTYGLVSGLFQSAFAFGSFFGPTVGGFAVERIGFPWTCSIIAFIHVMFICTVLFFYGYRSCLRKKSDIRS